MEKKTPSLTFWEDKILDLKKDLDQHKVIYLRIKVVPKSGKLEFVEIMEDETWKIKLKAVPEKGAANQELIKFLAKKLALRKEKVSIVSGQTARLKLVKIVM